MGTAAPSWLLAGPEAGSGPSLFTWAGEQDDLITSAVVLSNAFHSVLDFQTG